jgi:hypothetical protein
MALYRPKLACDQLAKMFSPSHCPDTLYDLLTTHNAAHLNVTEKVATSPVSTFEHLPEPRHDFLRQGGAA